MAPEAPNQKRKRGRPSIASKNKESAFGRVPAASTTNHDEESRLRPETTQSNATSVMEESTAPKRRGRPRKSTDAPAEDNAPVAEESAISESVSVENGESSNPKKRGRPAKAQNKEPEVEDAPADATTKKRPRQATEARADENEPPAKVRKTGKAAASTRTKASQVSDQAETNKAQETATVRRSARERRSADSNPYWSRNPDASSPETNRSENNGRSSLRDVSVAEAQNAPNPEVTDQSKEKKRGRGRPSPDSNSKVSASSKGRGKKTTKEASQDADAESSGAKKGKETRRKSDEASHEVARATQEKATKNTRKADKRPRDSVSDPETAADGRRRATRTRRSSGDEEAEGEGEGAEEPTEETTETEPQPQPQPQPRPEPKTEPAAEVPKYRHLAPRTRQIPRSVIAAKWTPLDDGSISAVDSIISDACRTVLHQLRDRESRREQAETAVNAFARRLHSKLVKGLPFPPPSKTTANNSLAASGAGSHETELDFDRIMGAITSVEATLDPLLHSVALLTREKEKEEAALEADYKQLRRLKSNMRDENRKWIEHAKREHVLVPGGKLSEAGGSGFDERDLLGQVRCVTVDGIEIVKRPAGDEGQRPGGVFMDIPSDDEELTGLSQRIGKHMNSMKSNLAQIDGVLPAITKSKASLQGVLHRYLDPKLYEEVLLGKEETK
ncbi:CENP-Q, a CENPA-CAD centromere complex subunit domain containing protein [Naviculisporaceae sp. PSN 640]